MEDILSLLNLTNPDYQKVTARSPKKAEIISYDVSGTKIILSFNY